ncbi:MAG: LytR family transcriptional regulator [Lachnospiraceae bacterium]|nr:LytR family transcriptional regulator [Lachnospiraceae bacterium]MCI8986184.1 LytR family transcriptional regulator [Lachnospiraceae bacterium]MCI9014923.1 LytR family transcriptional regulator [Lachnospiraceae bacterium]MCI9255822.1 LytR family transcriptional regulator [Lachnospiraceae bacterium]
MIITGSLLVLLLMITGGIGIVRAMGKNRLYEKADRKQPEMIKTAPEEVLQEEEETEWKEGWVRYQGNIYEYKSDILTFLVMGIDKNKDVEKTEEGTDGGQADALFLVVVDPSDRTLKIVGINRNTMTDIAIYDENGDITATVKAQIAVQHGFGDGMEESCEYQKKAVENLFYGLPIHGYAAVNMKAISTINDAVGGVEVTVLEDLTRKDKSLVKDAKVHLTGKTAFWYVQYRDTTVFGSADLRLARQKQYLNGFVAAAKKAAKENISVILDLYQAVMPQMVTDVSLDEVAYLAPLLVDYRFSDNSFYTMTGETVAGEQFEEFYVDETALYELILEVFYEKVESME